MTDTQTTTKTAGALHMEWVSVRDERGRTRLEAHWVGDDAPRATHAPHAA